MLLRNKVYAFVFHFGKICGGSDDNNDDIFFERMFDLGNI